MKLNLTMTEFCNEVGLPKNGDVMKSLRDLGLVGFWKLGRKFMYYGEDVKKISNKLRKNEIELKTDKNRYYITLNKKVG